MAYFLRTRNLNITRLDKKPQENISVVHTILVAAIGDVLKKLQILETSYYGKGKNADNEVRKYAPSVLRVMKDMQVTLTSILWQMDELVKKATYFTEEDTEVDMYHVNRMKEFIAKVTDAVPHKFKDLCADVKKILKYIEKYCLSFYNLVVDTIELDTAKHYEKQRCDWRKKIRKCLAEVEEIEEKFKVVGYFHSDLKSIGIELSRKHGCEYAPILVLFPECCERIRECCTFLKSWIEADVTYAEFLQHDINELECKQRKLTKKLKAFQNLFFKNNFRLKYMVSEWTKEDNELEKLLRKELDLLVDEEMLVHQSNEMQVEIEMNEYRKDDLIKSSGKTHPAVQLEKLSELTEKIRSLKIELPSVKRQLVSVRHKLQWIESKKNQHETRTRNLEKLQTETNDVQSVMEEYEVEVSFINAQTEFAHRLHLYKTSPDALSKIFFDQPVARNYERQPGKLSQQDPFEQACLIVESSIEAEWPAFYRALPFYPARGDNVIDDDISYFKSQETRIGFEETVRKCLHRWRRYHTRCRMEDLKDALIQIGREDIIKTIDGEMEEEEPAEEKDPYYYVEDYLKPFVKEVERFDELHAQGRI